MNARNWCLALAAALLLLSPFQADAATHRIRAVTEWETLRTELLDTATAFPAAAVRIGQAVAVAEGGRMLLEDDLGDVVEVFSRLHKGLGPPYPPELVAAFDALAAKLAAFTTGVLDDFETEIDTFVAANPGSAMTKQRKAR